MLKSRTYVTITNVSDIVKGAEPMVRQGEIRPETCTKQTCTHGKRKTLHVPQQTFSAHLLSEQRNLSGENAPKMKPVSQSPPRYLYLEGDRVQRHRGHGFLCDACVRTNKEK